MSKYSDSIIKSAHIRVILYMSFYQISSGFTAFFYHITLRIMKLLDEIRTKTSGFMAFSMSDIISNLGRKNNENIILVKR